MREANTQAPQRWLHGTAQRLLGAVREIYQGLLRDDVLMLAASIAYAAGMSLFPVFVGLIVLLSRFADRRRAQQPRHCRG